MVLDDPLDRSCCCCGEPLEDDQEQAHPECWAEWHADDDAERYGLCWLCDEPLVEEDQAWLEAHPDCVDRAASDPDLPLHQLRGRHVEDVPDPLRRFA